MNAVKILAAVSSLCAFAIVGTSAIADPVKLNKAQLDQVVAGNSTVGGHTTGHSPSHHAPGQNPSHHAPGQSPSHHAPGQHK